MHNTSKKKDFLAKLPPLLATLSKAFLVALREQALEVARALREFLDLLGRLFLKSAKWLWAIYYQVETQILGVIVDLVLAVVALRYFFLLLVIGAVLVYFEQWLLVVGYVTLLLFASLRFFRIDSETAAQQEKYHKQSHDRFIRLLRWPLRALASVVLLYASWQFIEWRSLNVLWSHQNPAEIRTVEETRKAAVETHHPQPQLTGRASIVQRQPTNDDSIKAGVAAFHAGEYTEAYRLLKPLAEQGNADAQAYVRFISEKVRKRPSEREVAERARQETEAQRRDQERAEAQRRAQQETERHLAERQREALDKLWRQLSKIEAPQETMTPMRSVEGHFQTQLTFINHATEPVVVYWIDYAGTEVFYQELAAGQSYVQRTYVTHPWRIRSKATGAMLRTVVAGQSPQIITVR